MELGNFSQHEYIGAMTVGILFLVDIQTNPFYILQIA